MSAARAKKKPQEEFNLFDALKMLEKEKGIPVDYMIEKIQTAIAQAIKKDPFNSENSVVEIDPETGRLCGAAQGCRGGGRGPNHPIGVEDAAKYQSGITAGSVLEVALDPKVRTHRGPGGQILHPSGYPGGRKGPAAQGV